MSNPWDNIHEKGEENFKQYVLTLHKLFVKKGRRFDCILAVGNSGSGIIKLTEIVFQKLNVMRAKLITLPIYRYKLGAEEKPENIFDNSSLLTVLERQIAGLDIKNILFIDDEIYLGLSIEISVDLISKVLNKDVAYFKVTIVAEDQGFNIDRRELKFQVEFIPFNEQKEDLYNVLCYLIPKEIDKRLQTIFPDESYKIQERLAILLGQPVKQLKDGKPTYSYELIDKAERELNDFKKLQTDFIAHIENLTQRALQ